MNTLAARSNALPVPGLVWGLYPRRPDTALAARPLGAGWIDRAAHALQAWSQAAAQGEQPARLAAIRTAQAQWQARFAVATTDPQVLEAPLQTLRARLARDGFSDAARRSDALGCVAAAGEFALQRSPYDCQLVAAGILLDDGFAEMATGEGKTYALGLAAAVAALAGVPVHLITANDYLAERDAQLLAPFYQSLGLRVGVVLGGMAPEQRRAAYACDVTCCTAREVAFDHLRDTLAAQADPGLLERRTLDAHDAERPAPLLRGLCMAIVDEADSVLIDEGSMPLLLAEAHDDPQQRAACFQALAIARQMQAGTHVDIDRNERRVRWLAAAHEHVATQAARLGGAWHNRRHCHDLVATALEALHLMQRDRDYLVRDGAIELLDAVTGRAAPGRVWSRGLHTLVELKEGLRPSPAAHTRAQISAQRFFGRYLRLAGMSGTLAECRGELAALFDRRVVPVALRRPSQRRQAPTRWFANAAERVAAVADEVQQRHRRGQPVLIGTDSVEASEALSRRLDAAGIAHRVLNARHDRTEADIVAAAGQRGAVTIATHMAGRGTDIALGDGVAALGGLHVLACQDNPSARLDRQLVGRSGRQGEPGSAQLWRCLDAPAWAGAPLLSALTARPGAAAWADRLAARAQQAHESRQARERRRLLEQDLKWHT